MWVKGEIFRDLADAQMEARGGLDRRMQPSIFDRLEWFRRTWTHCPVAGTPLIVRARVEGTDAWTFLVETQPGRAVGLASWYTLAFRIAFTSDASDAVKRALIVATARRLRKRLASITLETVPAEEAATICNAFTAAGWIAHAQDQVANWTIDVEGKSFEDFWAERPGQLRSTARRKAAKSEIATQVFDRFDEAAWDDYCQIYAASWKPEEGSVEFLRDLAMTEGEAGTLRLGIARIDGRAVAAQLWTVEAGTAIIHKLAHREDAADQSPGTVLSHAMFEHVITNDKVALIDFGTGDDAYKADWMDTRTMRQRVSLYNPRRIAGLAGAARSRLAALVGRGRNG
jgi:hypothetical protein